LTTEAPLKGHCVWYGECGPYGISDRTVNCNYTGPAKELTDPAAISLFQGMCPDLYNGNVMIMQHVHI
jgi:hypothetical protein